MKVLIGFEESAAVLNAFLAMGFDAWSCDLQPTRGDPARHYQCDIYEAIYARWWDLIIIHPPCTALAVSGNRWYGRGCEKHEERINSITWTMTLWDVVKTFSFAAMENPVGVLPEKPNQYIQPWEFGHGETKKTGLWLHNLPPLMPTDIVSGRDNRVHRMPPGPDRAKIRSETYRGIAEAMASQWGDHIRRMAA